MIRDNTRLPMYGDKTNPHIIRVYRVAYVDRERENPNTHRWFHARKNAIQFAEYADADNDFKTNVVVDMFCIQRNASDIAHVLNLYGEFT